MGDNKAIIIDAIAPEVNNIVVSPVIISDSTTSFSLTVTYSEDMDTDTNPSITFPVEDPTNTITFDSGNWDDNKTYTATYTIADGNQELADIDVRVENAQDEIGNLQTTFTSNDLFSIDNQNPNAPSINTFTSDTGNSGDGVTNDNTLIISGNAEENSSVEVFLDGVSIGSVAASNSGVWNFDYTSTTLNDGTYIFTAKSTDNTGNISNISSNLSVTVDAVNDAPVLDNTGNMIISAIAEDDINNSGTLITDIINSDGDRITDSNQDAVEGIAVTSIDNSNGKWQYSINGNIWNDFVNPNINNAYLLAADSNTSIRFVPDTNYNGTVNNGITFRAWDKTSGNNGDIVDTTSNGGNTAFSSGVENAAITVNSINDVPTVENAIADQFTIEDNLFTFQVPASTFIDVDTGDNLTYSATLANGNPLPNWLSFDTDTQTFSGTPTDNHVGDIEIKVIAKDTKDATVEDIFTLTVSDNDIDHTITADTTSISEGDSGIQTLTFTITRTGSINRASTVDYSINGTAINGNDYNNISGTSGATALSGNISFEAGESEKTITVDLLGDTLNESNETIQVSLSNASTSESGFETTISKNSASIAIADDDISTLSISTTINASEPNVNGLFTVTLDKASDTDTVIDYLISGSGISGDDYKPLSDSVTILGNQKEATINLEVIDDDILESLETVIVTLDSVTNNNNINIDSINNTATIEISDDETQSSISISDVTVNEGDDGSTIATLTVQIENASNLPVSVDYTTADNTAIANQDYLSTTGTLTFQPGITSQTIDIHVCGDYLDEPNENFFVDFSNSVNATLNNTQAEITIIDDDTPGVTITPLNQDFITTEAGGSASFDIVLESKPIANVSFGMTSSNNSEGSLANDRIIFTPNTWNVPKTISVTGVDDAVADGDTVYQIIVSNATSLDSNYHNQPGITFNAINIDNEQQPQNSINGTSSSENITGTDAGDFINSENGNDILIGGNGGDVIDSGSGNDRVFGDFINQNGVINGNNSDIIYAGSGNDIVYGGTGDDWLYGEDGVDQIWGNDGNDRLWGGQDTDYLEGGAGNDTFVLGIGEGTDIIQDFQINQDAIALKDGLTYLGLTISQVNEDVSIINNSSSEVLAILNDVNAADLKYDSFTRF